MKNVEMCMRSAYESGLKAHPQKIMRDLGIDYFHAVPQSISDSWDFWGCENLPEPLPSFLREITRPPEKCIGWGLSQGDVDRINEHFERKCAAARRINFDLLAGVVPGRLTHLVGGLL